MSVRSRCSESSTLLLIVSGRLSRPPSVPVVEVEAELRRDHDLVADGLERLADELLVRERPVHLRGVEERHAALDRGARSARSPSCGRGSAGSSGSCPCSRARSPRPPGRFRACASSSRNATRLRSRYADQKKRGVRQWPVEGGCSCGAVRYRLASDPMFVHCCHCLNCQRQTGSAFVINLLIEADRLEVLAGRPAAGRRAARRRRARSGSSAARPARSRSTASTGGPRCASSARAPSTTRRAWRPTCTSSPGRRCPG